MATGTSLNDSPRSRGDWEDVAASHATPFDPGEAREQAPRRIPAFSAGVDQVMTRNVRSCRPDDTLATAARAMWEADCRFLPVVDQIGHPVGALTDGDICLLGSTENRALREVLVREAMSEPVLTCRATDGLCGVLNTMRERHIRHMPVVDAEGKLVGVVSLTDLVLFAEEENSPRFHQEIASTLRTIMQKHGDRRIVLHNPFVGD